jgi:DNA-binding GntR family transcriptional regulator
MRVIEGGRGAGAAKTKGSGLEAEAFADRGDSLVGKIAADITRRILDGELAPGADLNSVELATRFGTSRTPVREALMLLEKEGLVEIPPRRRPRVARITWRDIEELYHIRAELNAMKIRLFVASASADAMQEGQAIWERMRAFALRTDLEAFARERMRLHDHWAANCGNATLQKMLATWRMRLNLRRMVVMKPEHMERSVLDHHRLMIALEERDAPLASALMHAMTLAGLEAIRQGGWGDAGSRKPPT